MKTKHLFYTMALASAFAACTNEEIINEAPQLSVEASRPTVANVTLDLGSAESRMSYSDSKFTWEKGDEIAVMLMDQNNTGVRYGSSTKTDEWEALSWLERYHLVDYVHTNYPFVRDADGIWKTDANMLEGNYFLVYPRAEFDGKRQAWFDISQQKQVGNTAQSRKDAYAKNQRFIGYARLDAAEGPSSFKAKMSEVLAPVRVDIQSNCTQVAGEPLEIRKIVLTHPTFHSKFSIDPTTADYLDWNLTEYAAQGATLPGDNNDAVNNWSYEQFFNYANYLTATKITNSEKELYMHEFEGSVDAKDYVWNAYKMGNISDKWSEKPEENKRKADTYYYDEAIRAAVKPLWKENYSENVTKYIEVYTYAANGTSPYTLASGSNATLGVIAMVPAFNDWGKHEETGLELYIYTNKGLVGPVDLSVKHTGNTGSSVQTTDAILAADPRIDMNTVTVIIDDDDVIATPDSKLINNTDDLANYVDYYTKNATNSRVDVTITNDIEINDELASKIIAMKEDAGVDIVSLYITSDAGVSKNANIVLNTKVNKNILNWLDIDANILVEVAEGAVVDLGPNAHNYISQNNNLNILVDNGGTLNFVEDMSSVGGWSVVADYAALGLNTIVTNNGTVNIKSAVANHAGLQIENNNEMNVEAGAYISLAKNSVNTLNGVINVEAAARLGATTNENIVNRGKIVNRGEVYSVENAVAALHADRIKPGRIVIDAVGAMTTLKSNAGKVIYNVLPTVPVVVATNDYNTGMYIFVTDANVTTEDLAKHHVTDATINGATLGVDESATNLRRLTLNNGSTLETNLPLQATAELCFNTVASANNAAWDTDYETKHLFTTNGNVTFDNVEVCFENISRKIEMNEGKITALRTVGFYESTGGAAVNVGLNAIEMTVGNGTVAATFKANNLNASKLVTSTVWVRPNATLDVNAWNTAYIVVNR